jgi:hypothetical protein
VRVNDSSIEVYLNNTTLVCDTDMLVYLDKFKKNLSDSLQPSMSFLLDDIKTSTQVSVFAFDIVLVHQHAPISIDDCPREFVLWFDEAKLSTDLIPDTLGYDVRVNIPRIGVLMSNQHVSGLDKTFGIEGNSRIFEQLPAYAEFAEIMSIKSLDILALVSEGQVDISVSNDNMLVDVCANTFESLMALVKLARPDDVPEYHAFLCLIYCI